MAGQQFAGTIQYGDGLEDTGTLRRVSVNVAPKGGYGGTHDHVVCPHGWIGICSSECPVKVN